MRIAEIANVSQGSILTRIKSVDSKGVSIEALTMQELSYYCNQSDLIPMPNCVVVDNERFSNCLISKEHDVIIGLSSGNAMVIEKDRTNKLLLSNFAVIRINDLNILDPYYLCWLLNEEKRVKAQLTSLTQKTSRVIIIPISTFKDVEIECIDIERQRKIGAIYDLTRRDTRIKRQKTKLRNKILNKELSNIQ